MTVWEAIGTVLGSFGVALGASLLPIGGGVELYLLTTSALLPTSFVGPLVVASAAGSVVAKSIIFLGAAKATSAPKLTGGGGRRAAVATRIQEGPWIRRGVILLSTTISLPPFYALAVAAGALRTPLSEFVLLGLVGQSLRFGFIWAIPQLGWAVGGG